MGSSEQPVKMSLPLRVGGGVEKNNKCNYLACTIFTITKKCFLFLVCLTNAVPKVLGKFYVLKIAEMLLLLNNLTVAYNANSRVVKELKAAC